MDIVFGKICIFHVLAAAAAAVTAFVLLIASFFPGPRRLLVMYDLSWCWRLTRGQPVSSMLLVGGRSGVSGREEAMQACRGGNVPAAGQQSPTHGTQLMLMRRSVRGIAALNEVLEGQTHLRVGFVNQREHIVVIVVTVVGGILLVAHVGFQERVFLLG